MNKTSWHMLLAFGSAAAVAAACTVSSGSSDDDEGTTTRGSVTSASGGSGGDGGSGGEDSTTGATTDSGGAGGAAGESGETTTTTTGAMGGTGGGGELECLEEDDPTGEPATCEDLDPDANSCCTLCAAANCCDELGSCYALEPENVCGVEGGEIEKIQECMLEIEGLPGLEEGGDLEGCFAEAVTEASSPLCDLGTVSGATNNLAVCLHGDDDGLGGCFEECFTDFDDANCTYD